MQNRLHITVRLCHMGGGVASSLRPHYIQLPGIRADPETHPAQAQRFAMCLRAFPYPLPGRSRQIHEQTIHEYMNSTKRTIAAAVCALFLLLPLTAQEKAGEG